MKKLLFLMLALCLCLALVACGGNSVDGGFEKPGGDEGDGGNGGEGGGEHTHAWGEWSVCDVPTYEAGGTLMRFCPDCPWASETLEIPKLDTESYTVKRLWSDEEITCADGEVTVEFIYRGQDERGDFEIQVWFDEHYSVPHAIDDDAEYTIWTKENHYKACSDCGACNSAASEAHTMADGECTVCHYVPDQLIYDEGTAYSTGVGYTANEETVVIPAYYGGSNPEKAGFLVTSIDSFKDNTNLKSLTIPATIDFIASEAFLGCEALENVYYEGTWEDWCDIYFVDRRSNPMFFASNFYMRDENGEWAKVTEINIPDTVTEIKDSVFIGFTGIEKLTIPASVTKIGNAFCDDFSSCHNWHVIIGDDGWPSGYTCEFGKVYYGGSLEDWCRIEFSKYARVLEKTDELYLFEGGDYVAHTSITEVEIPADVTVINDYLFCGFSGLQRVKALGALTEIGEYAFLNCGELVDVDIGVGCKKIDRGAFANCVKLDVITLPADLELIYFEAFDNVDSIDRVYFNGDVADWCKVQITSEGSGSDMDVSTPMRNGKATFYTLGEDGAYYSIYESNYFPTGTGVDLYNYFLVIPESVTEIGQYQFYGFDLDESVNVIVVFEGDLKKIGDYSFANAKVDYVFLPKSVESIGYNALKGTIDAYMHVYYMGTPTELNEISSDASLDLSVMTLHFYAETEDELYGVGYNCWCFGDDGYVYEWVYSSAEDKWVKELTEALSRGVFTD